MAARSFFDDPLGSLDLGMEPYFGGVFQPIDASNAGNLAKDDPYPLMYLEDQSQIVPGAPASHLGRQQQYKNSPYSFRESAEAGATPPSRHPDGSLPSTTSPSLTTATSSGSMDSSNSPIPRARRKSVRSKSGSVSGEMAEAAEPPKKRRPRKSSKAGEKATEEDPKRGVVLARNRVAALKCRQKKKVFVSDLEEQRVGLEKEHHALQNEYHALLSAVTSIKTQLMDHATCNDPHIDNWLDLEARRFVQSTKKRYSREYCETGRVTYEQVLNTAAPVSSALSGVASSTSTHRNSVSENVVSTSAPPRDSTTYSQGGLPPRARSTNSSHSTGGMASVNPSELTTYAAVSSQTSPTVPDFTLSLSVDADSDADGYDDV